MDKDLKRLVNLKEVLEAYKHISLTKDEILDAIIAAKIKKEKLLDQERIKLIEEQNRRRKSEKFDFMAISTFMMKRAHNLYGGKFSIDNYNQPIFEMMCYYFNNDSMFLTIANAYGVKNTSLDKGLLLCGNFGTGKSWLMKLFHQNKRQCFFIREAKKIAEQFATSKEKEIPEEYITPFENGYMDGNVFYQPYSGLCIDDLGAEEVKNNFGNKSNVIGEIIERRYSFLSPNPDVPKLVGNMCHGTTNLSAEELKTFYGERVTSRMREIFNFIECKGPDRRK